MDSRGLLHRNKNIRGIMGLHVSVRIGIVGLPDRQGQGGRPAFQRRRAKWRRHSTLFDDKDERYAQDRCGVAVAVSLSDVGTRLRRRFFAALHQHSGLGRHAAGCGCHHPQGPGRRPFSADRDAVELGAAESGIRRPRHRPRRPGLCRDQLHLARFLGVRRIDRCRRRGHGRGRERGDRLGAGEHPGARRRHRRVRHFLWRRHKPAGRGARPADQGGGGDERLGRSGSLAVSQHHAEQAGTGAAGRRRAVHRPAAPVPNWRALPSACCGTTIRARCR